MEAKSPELRTSSRVAVMAGLLLFVLLFAAGGAWLYFAQISGAVIAAGRVSVPGKPKTIQHLDGGIVASIEIDDGDAVKTGDVLLRLDDVALRANLEIYQNRLVEGIAKKARLETERDDLDRINWLIARSDILDIVIPSSIQTGHNKLFVARSEGRSGQAKLLRERIAQLKNEIAGIKALRGSKSNQLNMLQEELDGVTKLNSQGYATNTQLLGLERNREELLGHVAEYDAKIAGLRNAVGEAEIQILQSEREFRQSVLTELRETESEIGDLTQQFIATSEQINRVEIKSPVDGIIHDLAVHTIGGVVAAGSPILQIVPYQSKFDIEARVDPQSIDDVRIGQPTTLRFSAFNQRTTPELNGYVASISANVLVEHQTGVSFYKMLDDVDDNELARLNDLTLVPGMPVEAFIQTTKRSALSYLLKPLQDQLAWAFREQ